MPSTVRRARKTTRGNPGYAPEQASAALANAQTNRLAGVAAREALANGSLTFTQLLEDPPPWLAARTPYEVVQWLPGIGSTRLATLNRRAMGKGVNLAVVFDRQTQRQRDLLLVLVNDVLLTAPPQDKATRAAARYRG